MVSNDFSFSFEDALFSILDFEKQHHLSFDFFDHF